MHFGLYYLMPVALAHVGLGRRWGAIGWRQMALTMLLLALLVWGVWNSIAYTTGQFMEWTHGRYFPGEGAVDEAGKAVLRGARAAPVQDTVTGKLGAGLLHGLISSVTSAVWCIAFGTVLIWLPGRARS